MSFLKTNSIDITVDGTTYNSLDDFGLAIENTDYLGEPVQDTNNRIYVPGRPGPLYLDDTVFGGTVFTKRSIAIKFGGIRTTEDWDSEISTFRNLFEGRVCQIVFANDTDWYWTGKVVIEAFQHQRQLGTFTFSIPDADPYKHQDVTVSLSLTAPQTITLANSVQKVCPTFYATAAVTITFNETDYTLPAETSTTFDDLVLDEGNNSLYLSGIADVTITYTKGSL